MTLWSFMLIEFLCCKFVQSFIAVSFAAKVSFISITLFRNEHLHHCASYNVSYFSYYVRCRFHKLSATSTQFCKQRDWLHQCNFCQCKKSEKQWSKLYISTWFVFNPFIELQSYSSKHAFIAAQSPMEHTMNDIWELIRQFRTSTIVLLCDFTEGNQVCLSTYSPLFWYFSPCIRWYNYSLTFVGITIIRL